MFKEARKYIIHLPHREDRKELFLHQDRELNLNNCCFFDAIKEEKGWLGCFLSHQAVIKRAKEEKLPYVVVLEDDIVFCHHFNKAILLLEMYLPVDWELVYLGGNNREMPLMPINCYVGACRRTLSTVGYIIKESLYDKVLELKPEMPIDVMYANNFQKGRAYCPMTNLVWQAPGYSDVLNTNVDYKREYKQRW